MVKQWSNDGLNSGAGGRPSMRLATRKAISPLFHRYFFVISPLFLRLRIEEITLNER
jgi:hypothetical protein